MLVVRSASDINLFFVFCLREDWTGLPKKNTSTLLEVLFITRKTNCKHTVILLMTNFRSNEIVRAARCHDNTFAKTLHKIEYWRDRNENRNKIILCNLPLSLIVVVPHLWSHCLGCLFEEVLYRSYEGCDDQKDQNTQHSWAYAI